MKKEDIIPEEFPEGPVGAATNEEELGKSTPWKNNQRPLSAFNYQDKEFHAGLDGRKSPGSHSKHDESTET